MAETNPFISADELFMSKHAELGSHIIHSDNFDTGDSRTEYYPGELPATDVTVNELQSAELQQQLSFNLPYVSLLCAFNDINTWPHDVDFYEELNATSAEYWLENSYGYVTGDGSAVVGQLVLPENAEHYQSSDYPIAEVFNDCIAVADPLVDFSGYLGINVFLNADLDGFAHGGQWLEILDGVQRYWRMTILPDWGHTSAVIAAPSPVWPDIIYTFELRTQSGFDSNLLGADEGIVVHKLDMHKVENVSQLLSMGGDTIFSPLQQWKSPGSVSVTLCVERKNPDGSYDVTVANAVPIDCVFNPAFFPIMIR